MTVQVKHESDLALFTQLSQEVFDARHLRTNSFFLGRIPLSIQVLSGQVGPIVPINNPINVDHRNDIKDIIFPEEITLFGLWQNFVN